MVKKKLAGSFKAQSEEIIREEAMRIAKAHQAPGQSKETTKQIARGIANGIAQYKKQEKQKQRERDKLNKKRKAPAKNVDAADPNAEYLENPAEHGSYRMAGLASAVVFFLIAASQFARVAAGASIIVGSFQVPFSVSGIIGSIAFVLAIWVFRATRD